MLKDFLYSCEQVLVQWNKLGNLVTQISPLPIWESLIQMA